MLQHIKEKQRAFYYWLMRPAANESNRIDAFAHRTVRVIYALLRDLSQGTLTLHAMSLVFTSILSIVPLLALSFSLLRYFNVQNHFLPMIENFLLPMGAKGEEIHQTIMQFVDNVKIGVLGAVGLVLLLYTVVSLVQKVEHALNQIWYVANTRSLSRKLSNYMSMIFVGPILLVAAISLVSGALESAIITKLKLVEPFGLVFTLATDLMPYVILVGAFTFFYVLVPNTRVKTQNALVGAIVAGVVWQMAGHAFTSFVVSSARYDVIYSGFAVGIVALLWLYASWLILLLGASIAFYMQNDNYITRSIEVKGAPQELEQLALRAMVKVADAQETKQQPIKQTVLESMHGSSGLLVRRVVEALVRHKLIIDAGADGDYFVLARSSDLISVSDILSAIRTDSISYYASEQKGLGSTSLKHIQKEFDDFIEQAFSKRTLRSLID